MDRNSAQLEKLATDVYTHSAKRTASVKINYLLEKKSKRKKKTTRSI